MTLLGKNGVELGPFFFGPNAEEVVEVVVGLIFWWPNGLTQQPNDGLVQAHAVLFGTKPDGGVDFGGEIADCDSTHASILASSVMHSMHHGIGSTIRIVTDFLRIPRVFNNGA